MKQTLGLVAIALLAGCMQNTVEMQTKFDPNAGNYILARGSGAISGQAFMRQAGGGVVTCAGETVQLLPATPYQQERIKIIYGSADGGSRTTPIGNVPPPISPGVARLSRNTQCDANGNFEFTGLAPGEYYVSTRVEWLAGEYSPQGGPVAQRVRLAAGQKTKVVLN